MTWKTPASQPTSKVMGSKEGLVRLRGYLRPYMGGTG
jgi:hypothetical protein